MTKQLYRFYQQKMKQLQLWGVRHAFGIFVFNTILVLLLLLRSADYFFPFLPLTINIIVLVALILSIILLNLHNWAIFFIALLLWLFAAFLRIVNVEVWAERTAVYAFEALIVAVSMLIIENIVTGKDEQETH